MTNIPRPEKDLIPSTFEDVVGKTFTSFVELSYGEGILLRFEDRVVALHTFHESITIHRDPEACDVLHAHGSSPGTKDCERMDAAGFLPEGWLQQRETARTAWNELRLQRVAETEKAHLARLLQKYGPLTP